MGSVSGTGERLHLRLFLEKQEAPVVAAMVSAGMDAAAVAQIEIVPTDAALRLLPRTMVHLFYWDSGVATYGEGGSSAESTTRLAPGEEDGAYRLLFCGEVFDLVYTKTAEGTRSMILNCQDFSNIWDTTYLYYLRFAPQSPDQRSVYAQSQSNFLGAPEVFDDAGVNGPIEFIANRLATAQSAATPALDGQSNLLGGLLSIIELIGGVHGKTVGLYDWATVAERRVRMMDQIATDDGETASRIFGTETLQQWIRGRLGDMGEVISFRQIISTINSYVYYEIAPNPVGVYVGGSRTAPYYPPQGTVATEQDPDLLATFADIKAEMARRGTPAQPTGGIGGLRTREQAIEAGAPDSMHQYGLAQDWSAVGNPVGYHYLPERASGIWGNAYRIWAADSEMPREELFRRIGTEDARALDYQIRFWVNLKETVDVVNKKVGPKRQLISGQTFNNPDSIKPRDLFLRLVSDGKVVGDPVHIELADARERVQAFTTAAASAVPAPATETAQRLQTQFFRPNVWFVAPPVCNIIFPEECSSFTFRRQMMREVTRLELDTFNVMYSDSQKLLQRVYFAPVSEVTESLTTAGGGVGQASKSIVYPHEIYSGLIPKLEHMSDVGFYARLAELTGPPKEDEGGTFSAEDASNEIDRMASRAAFFHFMSYRYGARTMSASCRFLPRLVVGFPGLVIDRPSSATAGVIPTHFLGMITSLQHSVGQGGGSTIATFSHARSHKTGQGDMDDLFSRTLYENGQLFATQFTGQVSTDVDIEEQVGSKVVYREGPTGEWRAEPVLDGGAGGLTAPGDANVRAVVVFALQWLETRVSAETSLRIGLAEIPADLLGPNGKPVESIEFRGASTPGTGTEAAAVTFSTLRVTEHDAEMLPLEEALRPAWFSEQYSNARIGPEIYQPFFGADSVMEIVPEAKNLEEVVDNIAKTYSVLAEHGTASDYIWFTTYRAGASLPNVLLSAPAAEGSNEGAAFHYYAGGPFKDLEKLDLVDGQNASGQAFTLDAEATGNVYVLQSAVPGKAPHSIDPAIDPRTGRHDAVRAYIGELAERRAFRG